MKIIHKICKHKMNHANKLSYRTCKTRLNKLSCIEYFCKNFDSGRGIWKQIDEVREILDTLNRDFPHVLRNSAIEGWIHDTDLFLNCLLQLLELEPDIRHPKTAYFPRKWPGKLSLSTEMLAFENALKIKGITPEKACKIRDCGL